MRSHWTSPFPVYPGLQVQIMTLRGSSSLTTQCAFVAHGEILRHGFWHSPSKQASLLKQSPSVEHPVSSTTGSGTKDMFVKVGELLETESYKKTYLVYMQCHTDFLCNLVCTGRCRDVSEQCTLQTQHTDMDQHTCCSHIAESHGSQSPPDTHTACTYHMDFPCSPPNMNSRPCEILGCRQHSGHRSGKCKGPGTLDHSMPGSVHIRRHFDIQLMKIFHDKLRSVESSTREVSYVLCRQCSGLR